jgi:hypothetical protein
LVAGAPVGQISTSGPTALVQPPSGKYSSCRFTRHSFSNIAVRSHRGALAIVIDAGSDAVDAAALGAQVNCRAGSGLSQIRERSNGAQTNDAAAYGQAVWFWHPLLVSSRRRFCGPNRVRQSRQFAGDGDKTNSSQGERGVSRKAIAQGMSDASAEPVCSCAFFTRAFCTRDRGCSAHPAFPAPSDFRVRKFLANLGRIAPRGRRCFRRHCEERKRRSNPASFFAARQKLDCFASLAMTI